MIVDRLSYLPLDVPVILMGDFNALPLSPCHNIFTGKGQKRASMEGFLKMHLKSLFQGLNMAFPGISMEITLTGFSIAVKSR